ncbi:MAG: hypothetical protein HY865_02365 [Chloroflexi bacterium]|nr:hypothetical protein [Chloroflexota bacterium]
MTNEEWYFLNSAKIWLQGIVYQGDRLLENQQKMQNAMRAVTRETLVKHQDFLTYNDLRIVEEHFFVTSVSKSIDWLKEVKKFKPELSSNIDRFIHAFPETKDLRNMREHDVDYFKGEGKAQGRFVRPLTDVTIDASASMSDKNGYLIGGRLNVQQSVKEAQQLLPVIEKTVLSIHEID